MSPGVVFITGYCISFLKVEFVPGLQIIIIFLIN